MTRMGDEIGDVFSLRHDFGVGSGRIESNHDGAWLHFRDNLLGDLADESIRDGENYDLR